MSQTTALLLTLAIEIPIAVGLVAGLRWAPGETARVAAVALGATLITHPLLWMAADRLDSWPRLFMAEGLIALGEGLAYAFAGGLALRRGLLVSVVANAASFGMGLLIHAVT